jgi:hypothetical protein
VGAGQAIVYGAVAAGSWALHRPSRYRYADKSVRGLGKMLWFSQLNFYGLKGAPGHRSPAAR